MVHSDLIFWSLFPCKRRRFLSDIDIQSFLSQGSQDPVQPVLADSGGLSLHLLTEPSAGVNRLTLPPKSGNMRIRLLASARPSKRSLVHLFGA